MRTFVSALSLAAAIAGTLAATAVSAESSVLVPTGEPVQVAVALPASADAAADLGEAANYAAPKKREFVSKRGAAAALDGFSMTGSGNGRIGKVVVHKPSLLTWREEGGRFRLIALKRPRHVRRVLVASRRAHGRLKLRPGTYVLTVVASGPWFLRLTP